MQETLGWRLMGFVLLVATWPMLFTDKKYPPKVRLAGLIGYLAWMLPIGCVAFVLCAPFMVIFMVMDVVEQTWREGL